MRGRIAEYRGEIKLLSKIHHTVTWRSYFQRMLENILVRRGSALDLQGLEKGDLNSALPGTYRKEKEGRLNRLRRLISLTQAIGIDDPDLQHGRIGREAADRKGF
jgi:hypothetical protein